MAFEYTNETLAPTDPVTKRFRLADVPIGDTWAALEKLVAAGKIRSIGVSNCTIEKIEELLRTAKIPPAVNQIEAHPYFQQPKLIVYLEEKVCCLWTVLWTSMLIFDQDILPVAYSPLGNNSYKLPRYALYTYLQYISLTMNRVVDDPAVQELAAKLNKDPAALLISWAVQRGTGVVCKSVTPSRIESNFQGIDSL